MKTDSLVSIVITNWNGRIWLDKCLSSLVKQTYKNLEIIVVDNASTDDSIKFIKNNFPKVKIIENQKNLGFATANNIGIKKSLGDYVILLNNDTWVDSYFVEKIFKFYNSNKFDVVAPRERGYDKSGDYRGYSPIDFLGNTAYGQQLKYKAFALSGLCLFFRKDFYLETKGLDNDFFMYFEDVDWFWRLNLLGKKYSYCEDVYVYHAGSGTAGLGINYNTFLWRNENCLQMLLKNYSLPMLVLVLPIYVFQNLTEILFFLLTLKPNIAYSYIQGWMFNILSLKRILTKRKWVQSNRIVSDLEIIKKMYFIPLKLTGLLNYIK